ncbi:MAG: hypothetical protein GX493_10540 [Firmicutes bacterium]|nr:hypothetical protein [Bacillota bacterium]
METLLEAAKKRGVEAEAFTAATRQTSVQFENGRLKKVETSLREGMAVRVIVAGRLGFAAATLPADPLRLLEEAVALAEFGKEAGFSFPAATGVPKEIPVFDETVDRMRPEDLVAMGE